MMLDGVRILEGDCLAVLRTLPPGSVDHIVTDPPYGQTNEGYDGPIAFSPELWRECCRVAKADAALVSLTGSPTYHRIACAAEAGGWKVRQMWGWIYRNGFLTSAWPKEGFDRLAPAMDPIVYATKGKVLLRLEREGSGAWQRKRNDGEVCSWSDRAGRRAGSGVGRWPRTLIAENIPGFEYFALNPNSPDLRSEKTGHPNQKPLALMRWLCGKLPPGVVLDPFCGSGTTLLAAMAEGHPAAIGIEANAEYAAFARKRIADEASRYPLFAAGGA